jgi:hypothetical protein
MQLSAVISAFNEYVSLPKIIIDDDPVKIGSLFIGINVHSRDFLKNNPTAKVLAVPGSPTIPRTREQTINSLNIEEERFCSIIHPKAVVSSYAKLGVNCLVIEGSVIKANAKLLAK